MKIKRYPAPLPPPRAGILEEYTSVTVFSFYISEIKDVGTTVTAVLHDNHENCEGEIQDNLLRHRYNKLLALVPLGPTVLSPVLRLVQVREGGDHVAVLHQDPNATNRGSSPLKH